MQQSPLGVARQIMVSDAGRSEVFRPPKTKNAQGCVEGNQWIHPCSVFLTQRCGKFLKAKRTVAAASPGSCRANDGVRCSAVGSFPDRQKRKRSLKAIPNEYVLLHPWSVFLPQCYGKFLKAKRTVAAVSPGSCRANELVLRPDVKITRPDSDLFHFFWDLRFS